MLQQSFRAAAVGSIERDIQDFYFEKTALQAIRDGVDLDAEYAVFSPFSESPSLVPSSEAAGMSLNDRARLTRHSPLWKWAVAGTNKVSKQVVQAFISLDFLADHFDGVGTIVDRLDEAAIVKRTGPSGWITDSAPDFILNDPDYTGKEVWSVNADGHLSDNIRQFTNRQVKF